MISVEEALSIVLERAVRLPPETVDFLDAPGRVLAEDVVSDIDLPPFARSAVDGYALRVADVETLPARLRVVGTIPAGTYPSFRVGRGQAAQIMTGAPVPEGADAVQRVESTRSDDRTVEILETVSSGQNIAPRGSEVRRGACVLRAGTRVDPAAVAVAATVGKTRLNVGRRPRVAILATGDELVHPSEMPRPGQIRNSNGFSLLAQAQSVGAETTYLGVARDTEASLREPLRRGLSYDVLLLSGGVSMGRFDLVEGVLQQLGVEILVSAVALKPGKPLVFGARPAEAGLVFGLPGNPVSTMVTFELFVRPALAKMEGSASPCRSLVRAELVRPLSNRGPRRAFLPGWLAPDGVDGRLLAHPIETRGSGDIVAFSKANALLVVPEQRERLEAGEPLLVYPLDTFLNKEEQWDVARRGD